MIEESSRRSRQSRQAVGKRDMDHNAASFVCQDVGYQARALEAQPRGHVRFKLTPMATVVDGYA